MNLLKIARALASRNRLAVFNIVGASGRSAASIAGELGISVATASRSLHVLQRARLVESYVHGRERRFRWPRRRRLVIGIRRIDGS